MPEWCKPKASRDDFGGEQGVGSGQFSPAYAVLNRRVYRREDAEVHINRSN